VYVPLLLLLVAPLLAPTATLPDTLVICPNGFRSALAPWQQLREQQGHRIHVVSPPATAGETQAIIRRLGKGGQFKYLLLIGDVPGGGSPASEDQRTTIPTNYVPAKINPRWGSEPTIATDAPYADLDGDQSPDVAVGRIPADSAVELSAVVRKIIRYDQYTRQVAPPKRMNLVAGVGGFGRLADALVESAARQVFSQAVPPEWDLKLTSANPNSPHCPRPGAFRECVLRQFSEPALAWVYMGHGHATELDRVPTPAGTEPILSVADLPELECSAPAPLAVLVACYTGAIDARRDSLAEELVLAEQGPIAVIAATRVTMPYGNTVLGYELLRACFTDRAAELGGIVHLAKRRALADASADSLRSSLDALAQGISPPPIELTVERREHVQMYHLLGDPLTWLHRGAPKLAKSREDSSVR
jgi:hypothetical protein